jgi:predicted GNAT family acetyltransferase
MTLPVSDAAESTNIVVAGAPERERYEVTVDGELAGFTTYKARPGIIAFIHTEVEERFQHRGLGDRLIAYALADARKRALVVLPFCPFVRSFIQAHRDYVDLVPESQREAFEL